MALFLAYQGQKSHIRRTPECHCTNFLNYQPELFILSRDCYKTKFEGTCLDTGAYRTVICLSQLSAYAKEYNLILKPFKEPCRFLFVDQVSSSLGVVRIALPMPSGPKQIKTHIVRPSIPFLIGLDVLDAHRWNVLAVQNELESAKDGWKLACVRKLANIYLTRDRLSTTFYSKAALCKLHHHFTHPSATNQYHLLRRATPERLDPENTKRLKEIYDSYHICKTYSTKPLTFQTWRPDEIIFNKEVRIDLMFLQGMPVIHAVDSGANLSAALFLPTQSTDAIWIAFMYCWVTIYVG